jgi:hypothetical protein
MADNVANTISALSPQDQAAMQPETFVTPMVKALLGGMASNVAKPGQIMTKNPYPPGSEENSWYEDQRMKGVGDWAPRTAISMLGGGSPMAESGALGMAGGRTTMPGAVALRGPGGKFLKPMSDARGIPNPFIPEVASYKVPKPGEVIPTAEPANPMYTPENAPDMATANKLLERQQNDQLNVDPQDVNKWKTSMPNGFSNTTPEQAQLIKALLGK